MVQFHVYYDTANSPDLNQLTGTEQQTILDLISAAGMWWTRYLAPVNVTIELSVIVDDEFFNDNSLAFGGPDLYLNGALDGGVPVWEPTTQTKLMGGADTNGADADMSIWVSPSALDQSFFFNPNPFNLDEPYSVPAGLIDAMSVFMHEIGHGLGFISFSDSVNDPNFMVERSTYDTLIRSDHGVSVFDGPTAGVVTLQGASMSHLAENAYARALMSPSIGPAEVAYISPLEVNIMRDYGIPMRAPTAGDDTLYGFNAMSGVAILLGNDVINGGAGNDYVYGLTGDDDLFGGAGADHLFGGLNSDDLFGEAGNDVLEGGQGNDTMTGGGGLDYAVYNNPRADYTVNKVGSNNTVNGPDNTDTLTSVERIIFSDQTLAIRLAPIFDFSGEGKSDILFENTDGTVAVWLQNGLTFTGADAVGSNPGAAWAVKGAADFNGDANADILFQHTDGTVAEWQMNGLAVQSADAVQANAGTVWKVIGMGDFNSDLKYDILLQHNVTGQVAVWLMSGLTLLGGDAIAGSATGGWEIKGVGDFNGDTRSDILLQNSVTNQVAMWLMNGLAIQSADVVGASAGADWKVKGTGDFNGDGKSDILLQNNVSSQVAVWLMNGLSLTGGDAIAASAAGGWNVKGSEDLDGNGSSDVLLQNTDGTVAAWLMNGLNVVGAGAISSNPGAAWQIISPTG